MFYLYPFNLGFRSTTLPVQLWYAFMCIYFSSIIFINLIYCVWLIVLMFVYVCLYNSIINKKI